MEISLGALEEEYDKIHSGRSSRLKGLHGNSEKIAGLKISKQKRLMNEDTSNMSLLNGSAEYYPVKKATSAHTSLYSDSKGSLKSNPGSLASTNLSIAKTQSLHESLLQDRIGDMTPSRRAKVAEFENSTIQKQRNELQLLIAELKNRDKELNDMVTAHQKQLLAWERDRKRIITLEEKCSVLEKEILLKKDEIRTLLGQIKVLQSTEVNKTTALNNAQDQLASVTEEQTHMSMQLHDLKRQIGEITEQHSLASMEITDLEEKNRSLTKTIMELNTTIGQMDAREQELITVLKLKDKDMSESATRIAELSAKLKKLENSNEQSKRIESDTKRTANEWKNRYNQLWKEYDHLKREYRKEHQENENNMTELNRQKQELAAVRKEAILASERDKRKEQLLELQQSKQDRSEMELSNMRHLCDKQQRDLSILHLNLENTKEIVDKQQTRLLHQRKMELETGERSRKSLNCSTSSTSVLDLTGRSRYDGSRSPSRTSTRSPVRLSTRSPTRTSTRMNYTSRTSPHRTRSPDVIRSTSPLSRSYSPSRYHSRSPSHSSTSRIRNRSPSPRATSTTKTSSRYYSPSKVSYVPSYGEKGDSNRAVEAGRGGLYYGRDSYYSESALSKKYGTERSKYEDGDYDKVEEYPYKSYSSHDVNRGDFTSGRIDDQYYKPQKWAETKELAKSAEDIINRYYPLSEQNLLVSSSKRYDSNGGIYANANKSEVPREKENGSEKGSDISGKECAKNDDNTAVLKFSSDDKASELNSQCSVDITDPNILNDSGNDGNKSNQSDGFVFGSGEGFPNPGLEPVITGDDQVSAESTPRQVEEDPAENATLQNLENVSLPSLRAESVHSQKSDSAHSESVHSSRAENAAFGNAENSHISDAESVHSLKSASVHSERAESVHSEKADSVHSGKLEAMQPFVVENEQSDEVQSTHSSVGVSNHSDVIVSPNDENIQQVNGENDDEIEDMFSGQSNKIVQQRPNSTTPTNDVTAKDLLFEEEGSKLEGMD